MSKTSHQIVRGFLGALREGGELPDSMLTDDFSGWTVMSGPIDRAAYQAAFKLLSSLFEGGGPVVTIRSLTAEEDRVAAEFQSEGDLKDGAHYRNDYVFLFRVRDGRVAWVGEYFNPAVVLEVIAPAMEAAMAGSSS